ncbi:MAG: hypothetical protein IJ043_03255 [Clostridia bacterium]|nr:hypothetical protein [Clostridia bacterium]
MEGAIFVCVLLMLMVQTVGTAAVLMEKDRRTFKECREDRRLAQAQRQEKRERSEAEMKRQALMREIEQYDGTSRNDVSH